MAGIWQRLVGVTRPAPLLMVCLSMLLAGCSQTLPGMNNPFGGDDRRSVQNAPLAPVASGPVKVGLILPLSASGNAGVAATSMKNAAELALAEFQDPNTVQLLIKDDAGNAETARLRAEELMAEGAELILGPLFAPAVTQVSQVARAQQVPVIAFSTDASVAGQGTYLLSFLPENDVQKIIDHTSQSGKRSYAALIPESAYGTVVQAAFQQAVTARGGRIVALERYTSDQAKMDTAVKNIARSVAGANPQADVLFLPDSAENLSSIVETLASAGVQSNRLQIIGTGLWNDQRVWRLGFLNNGLFVAPDSAGYNGFAQRYRARFGTDPTRVASLSYDAVSLSAALAKTKGAARYQPTTLQDPQGFAGIDGLFRFRSDGLSERGLAILKATPQGPQITRPAPQAF